jgi:hypothetical protein
MEIGNLEPGGAGCGKRENSVHDVGIAVTHEDEGSATVWGEYDRAFVVVHRENEQLKGLR